MTDYHGLWSHVMQVEFSQSIVCLHVHAKTLSEFYLAHDQQTISIWSKVNLKSYTCKLCNIIILSSILATCVITVAIVVNGVAVGGLDVQDRRNFNNVMHNSVTNSWNDFTLMTTAQ